MPIPTISSIITNSPYQLTTPATRGNYTIVGTNLSGVMKVVIKDAEQNAFYLYPWAGANSGSLTTGPDGKQNLVVYGYPYPRVTKETVHPFINPYAGDAPVAVGPGDYVVIIITTGGTTGGEASKVSPMISYV